MFVHGSRGRLPHNGGGGLAAGGYSWKLNDHSLNCKKSRDSKLEVGQGCELSKPIPSDVLPPRRLQRLREQSLYLRTRCSKTGDSFHSNHHILSPPPFVSRFYCVGQVGLKLVAILFSQLPQSSDHGPELLHLMGYFL